MTDDLDKLSPAERERKLDEIVDRALREAMEKFKQQNAKEKPAKPQNSPKAVCRIYVPGQNPTVPPIYLTTTVHGNKTQAQTIPGENQTLILNTNGFCQVDGIQDATYLTIYKERGVKVKGVILSGGKSKNKPVLEIADMGAPVNFQIDPGAFSKIVYKGNLSKTEQPVFIFFSSSPSDQDKQMLWEACACNPLIHGRMQDPETGKVKSLFAHTCASRSTFASCVTRKNGGYVFNLSDIVLTGPIPTPSVMTQKVVTLLQRVRRQKVPYRIIKDPKRPGLNAVFDEAEKRLPKVAVQASTTGRSAQPHTK